MSKTEKGQLKSDRIFLKARPFIIIMALGVTLLPGVASAITTMTGEYKKNDILESFSSTEEFRLMRQQDIEGISLQNDGDIAETIMDVNNQDGEREAYIESKLIESSNTQLKAEYENAQSIIKVGKNIGLSLIPCMTISALTLVFTNLKYEHYKLYRENKSQVAMVNVDENYKNVDKRLLNFDENLNSSIVMQNLNLNSQNDYFNEQHFESQILYEVFF